MFEIIFPKMHKEGQKILAIALVINFFLFFISEFLGFVGIVLCVWVFYFFRDPERFSINDNSYLVSPADGKISLIAECKGPKELGLGEIDFIRISVFMNVFNCHVNRFPIDCSVDEIFYKPGKFLNASLDKASEDNERNMLKITSSNNEVMALVQIAGLVARRIVCEVNPGDKFTQGNRFGIIRFGSRVDLYLPKSYQVLSKVGQTVVAGESLIAKK